MKVDQVRDTCGTYAGVQAHKRRDETLCGPCRSAQAKYMREYRKRNPSKYAADKRRNAAHGRALWRLAERYPDEFRRLVIEELSA